jgi:REP-associated tyrosine transposase
VARKPRTDLPDSIHHVTALANGDARLFLDVTDRRRFIQQLGEVVRDHGWRCQAYCLMGTHFHLIVYTVEATLSAGMARLLCEYAQWFNWKHGRRGHLFAGRFWSHCFASDEHLMEAHRYVALNPVRAQHCADPADWRWGSYRALAGLEKSPDFLDAGAVHGLFADRRADAQRAYRLFVLAAIEGLGSDPSGQTPFAEVNPRNVSATRETASS